jgi:hypothetical protein
MMAGISGFMAYRCAKFTEKGFRDGASAIRRQTRGETDNFAKWDKVATELEQRSDLAASNAQRNWDSFAAEAALVGLGTISGGARSVATTGRGSSNRRAWSTRPKTAARGSSGESTSDSGRRSSKRGHTPRRRPRRARRKTAPVPIRRGRHDHLFSPWSRFQSASFGSSSASSSTPVRGTTVNRQDHRHDVPHGDIP